MIPFASQRGGGRDLATHLMNAFDNDRVEVYSVRGAIAPDLHGAFKEWEVQAAALTKCREYLYSLSINPDPEQGPLSRDQYKDYIARTEKALGLTGQPRAMVFHSKFGREHCHVVWSRIDAKNEKAVHLAFDKLALMAVTREFARDHGLTLPPGYDKSRGVAQRSRKDQARAAKTGLSVEDHKEQITDAWRQSDDNRSFVQALAERGYLLAAGRRGYCVVDLYGDTNALSRMIDDKDVRKADVEAFMAHEFPLDALPSVEEAERLVGHHRAALERESKADALRERHTERLPELRESQQERRAGVEEKYTELKARHASQLRTHETAQRRTRDQLRIQYLQRVRTVRLERSQNRPRGLAAFLGQISGVNFIREKLERHNDAQRLKAYKEQKRQLTTVQRQERQALTVSQRQQAKELERQMQALDSIDRRESSALERDEQRDRYAAERGTHGAIPSLLKLIKHNREFGLDSLDAKEDFTRAAHSPSAEPPDLKGDFERASRGHEPDAKATGDGKESYDQSKSPDLFKDGPGTAKTNDRERDF